MANKYGKTSITLPGVPTIQVKSTGNWRQIHSLSRGMGKSIQEGYNDGIRKISKQIIRIVRTAIMTGTPPPGGGERWDPLSPKTVKRKHGNNGPYLDTGQYLKAVQVYSYQGRTFIGVGNDTTRNTKSKLTSMNQLAGILEYGSSTAPDRPLWRPALKAYGGRDKIRRIILREIRKKLIAKHGLWSSQIKLSSW